MPSCCHYAVFVFPLLTAASLQPHRPLSLSFITQFTLSMTTPSSNFNVDRRSHSFVNTNIDTLAFPYHLINLIHFTNATNTAGVISAATRACVDLGPASSSSWWDYVGSSSGSTRAPAHGAGDATSSIAFTTPASESGRLIDVDGPVGANTGQVGSYRRLARRRKV